MNSLFTTDRAVAEEFCALLDEACGYPNPATLTERAVAIETTKDGYIVPIPEGVYSHKIKAYLDAHSILPSARAKEAPQTDATKVLQAVVDAAKQEPLIEEGKLAANDFVILDEKTKSAMLDAKAEIVVDPIAEPVDEPIADPVKDIKP